MLLVMNMWNSYVDNGQNAEVKINLHIAIASFPFMSEYRSEWMIFSRLLRESLYVLHLKSSQVNAVCQNTLET